VESGAAELDPRVHELIDKEDVRRVIMNFARGSDRHDFDLIRFCYHEGAYDNHGVFVGDAGDYVDWVTENLTAMSEASMHSICNVIIDLDRPTVARAESYIVGDFRYKREDGTRADWPGGGRYVDRFERRDGAWKIAHRVLVWEWARDQPLEMDLEGFGLDTSQFVWGKRGAEDLVYASK
jgi:hypothetical protein